jgi:putative PIN family toxin of toxin-antitoxin system
MEHPSVKGCDITKSACEFFTWRKQLLSYAEARIMQSSIRHMTHLPLSEVKRLKQSESPVVVLDTNIVLDLWVFDHPPSQSLRALVEQQQVRWLATARMRTELERVLGYPHLAQRLQKTGLLPNTVLSHFDTHAQLQPDAPKAPYTCKDPDDQCFIDLAVQHQARLWSKDAHVLCMKNRLARCGVALNR